MDNNGYYLKDNKEIKREESLVLDNRYSDKDNMYNIILEYIINKYNECKKVIKSKRRIRDGKNNSI